MYFCYVPCPDEKTARSIGEKAVQERLAACANLLPKMTSIYEWEGKIEEANETLLLLKTRSEQRADLENLILNLHPYEVPCVAFYSVDSVNSTYWTWVQKQTT